MDGYLISALIILFVLLALVYMRGMNEGYAEKDVTDYKVRFVLMLAKMSKGQPVDITKLSPDELNMLFKDFLIIFNEFQAKTNGKPITMEAVQATFPIDFLNEYNAMIVK